MDSMANVMSFPQTLDEFAEQYQIVDTGQIWTNGIDFIRVFKVKPWLEYLTAKGGAD